MAYVYFYCNRLPTTTYDDDVFVYGCSHCLRFDRIHILCTVNPRIKRTFTHRRNGGNGRQRPPKHPTDRTTGRPTRIGANKPDWPSVSVDAVVAIVVIFPTLFNLSAAWCSFYALTRTNRLPLMHCVAVSVSSSLPSWQSWNAHIASTGCKRASTTEFI